MNTNAQAFAFPAVLRSPLLILASGFALLLIFGMLFALCGNLFAAGALLAAVTGLLYTVSYYRLVLSGWVFVPSELSMAARAQELASFVSIEIYPNVRVFFAAMFACLAPLFIASLSVKAPLRPRMAAFSGFLAAALAFLGSSASLTWLLPALGVDAANHRPSNRTYAEDGVLLGFYELCLSVDDERTPAEPAEEELARMADRVKLAAPIHKAGDVKPNVIVIMSEAFFDPATLPNIWFSEDPAPNLRRLQAEYTSGDMLSPACGGATCNPEWEFLTGNAITFAGYGVMPYEHEDIFIPREDKRALPQIFKNNGYRTVSVHTYGGYFFNRETIYPKLGFDKSVFEEDMPGAPLKGQFISDEYFTDRVLEEAALAEAAGEPLFLYGISMQNHYSYDIDRYPYTDVTAGSGALTAEQLGSVNTYAQGVFDADAQLGRLIAELEKGGRPTIVLFFGDHLPLIRAPGYAIYDQLGYISGQDMNKWTLDDMYNMFTTTYVAWSNFGAKDDGWGAASPYFLGALLAEKAGLRLNWYYEFLLQAYHGGFHGYKDGMYVDTDDAKAAAPPDGGFAETFRAFQHDRVYGYRYVDDALTEMTP